MCIRDRVKTDKWNQKKKERWDRANQALERELARQKEAAAAAAQAAHRARQQSTPGYGSAPGGQGFDAGTGRTTTSGWSGRTGQKEMMARGGLAGLWHKR